MRIRQTIAIILMSLALATARAQEAKTLFTAMPDSLCPLLTAVNRADCIDFIESGMKAEVTNVLGRKTVMTHLTPTYICMESGNNVRWQMKVLPVNDSTRVVCVAHTVRVVRDADMPADSLPADSRLTFYSTTWQELEADKYMPALPRMEQFTGTVPDSVSRTSTYTAAAAEAAIPLVEAMLQPEGEELHLRLTTLRMLAPQTAKVLQPYVRDEVVWTWKDGRFKQSQP